MSSRGISSPSAKRRGADWVQVFHCRRRRHPTLFFIKRVCNNDLGSSGSPRKRNFVLDLLKSLPEAISATKNHFFKTTKNPQNHQKSKNLQNRPENQQLGPKLIQDDSPSLNNQFPTIFGQIPGKNPPKILENPLTSMP